MTPKELIILLDALPEEEKEYDVIFEAGGDMKRAKEIWIDAKSKQVGLA